VVCSVFTFGYGNPDPEYLTAIADIANGMFYYIDKVEAIPDAFSDCLGGLLSVVAQNIVLSIEASKTASIKSVITNYPIVVESPGAYIKVHIGDLYSEEQKDILALVEIIPLEKAKETDNVVEFNVEYLNVLKNASEYQKSTATISRPDIPPTDISVNKAIDKQRNRLTAAQAMEQALNAGKNQDYRGAQQYLMNAQNVIKASKTSSEPFCESLMHQLEQCKNEVKDKDIWEKRGQANLTSTCTSHKQQRGTHTVSSYMTSAKETMRSNYRSYSNNSNTNM